MHSLHLRFADSDGHATQEEENKDNGIIRTSINNMLVDIPNPSRHLGKSTVGIEHAPMGSEPIMVAAEPSKLGTTLSGHVSLETS
ncbi:hypothetical protein QJS10_CPA05g00988 [Acorus calamus]|uniref:Uncharacterized protein n=1 Tax=Acorus calamus TaxID=4465 RepID=A0AAV9EPU3_ACOCL|nr:hypothetical protein QJS10_CPA05g00988 [Acorus calamus]